MRKHSEANPLHEHDEDEQVFGERIRRAHEDRDKSRHKLIKRRERLRELSEISSTSEHLPARIVGSESAFFVARLEDGKELRTKSYKGTKTANIGATLVAVGDDVRLALQEDGTAIIEEVLERATKLSRAAAGRSDAFEQVIVSNIDLLVIVASATEPPLRSGIIDRYIVAGLDGGLEIGIAINKIDLASEEQLDEALYYRDVYQEIGYPVAIVSAEQSKNLGELREIIEGKTCVFAGHSGVGKSSLVNALIGREVGKTGQLSRKYGRGAHTTTSARLIEVDGMQDTYIVDTPGVREFANHELDIHNLKFTFVEFVKYQEHCAITNCSHIHEPGCAVRAAVEEDKIAIERYTNYQKLFEEAKQQELKRKTRS